MNVFAKTVSTSVLAITLATPLGAWAQAQGPAPPSVTTESSATPEPPAALPDSPHPSATTSDNWHGAISIYGWFGGLHGTVGAVGHDTSVHVPFSDLFHYLKGIIPIAVEVDKGRFVMPIDFLWMKLGDTKDHPFTDLDQTGVDLHITQSLLTPKFGYRILDNEKFKIDALAGIRYWHIGQNLALQPSGFNHGETANWVDGLGGARFIVPLGEKAAVTASGDAGGGGASLDYQVIGLLTYKFSPKLGLGLGWRYLYVDYTGKHQFIYNTATSGPLAGLFYAFGGKPPTPLTSSCTASPTQVNVGEPVSATISTQNFNPKHTVAYKWRAPGAKVSGSGTTATVDTSGLAPGSYTVTGTATDEKQKTNNSTSCNATFAVAQPPQHPPVASCSASPGTVKAGDTVTVSVNASSPDGANLNYSYVASSGSITGSGSTATLDTTGAQPGSTVTTTATVTDGRGLTTSCTAMVNVLALPLTVQEVKEVGECKFVNPKKPGRVDNECKAVLDDIALRIQSEPNGQFVIVGYADEEETIKITQLGAQRAVNVKYYLVQGEGGQRIDASRLEPRTGMAKVKSVRIYYVPPVQS